MTTTSVPHRWKYDVFVSFRGEDIRKNFMDHLFNDFKQKGIHAFRDDNDLPRGEYISRQLYKAIEESRVLIVIFSKDYASSSWCLKELVKILECKQTENRKYEVQIIFYDVKPNVVRKQTGSYAEAFAQHDILNRAEVDKWKKALSVAADLSGFDLQEMTNGCPSFDLLSDELRLFYWHGFPFKYLPSDFYPQNIVAIDLSYGQIKHIWQTPKCLRRLKIMKLSYCCNLTTTPDFLEITNLEELSLEGCVNLVRVHPSVGMLKRLVVLNMRDCKRLKNFPIRVEMDALQVLNLTGCLKVDQLPEALGQIKSLTELHVERTAIPELPSFVSSLINLESLSFGRIQPRWWTSITGLLSKQQHPQRSVSFKGLHMLKYLNLNFCNLEQLPDAIGGLSCLTSLGLKGKNFTSLPESLSQLSSLVWLSVGGCRKLEVLPELPPSLWTIEAPNCTSLREVSRSSKDPFRRNYNVFINCPKLFKNVTFDSEGSISKTRLLDSSITSQGSIHQFSAFLGDLGFPTNIREFFLKDTDREDINIIYHGNSIPEWFTNRSTENHVKVELPSDWCFNKFRGYGNCVVFKSKKPCKYKGYSIKNFDGALITEDYSNIMEFLKKDVIGIHESYMIWFHYTNDTTRWKKAKNFVTFSFEENNEDVEVKEFGARLISDEDLQQHVIDLNMFQDLSTLSQHAGAMTLSGTKGYSAWSW
nr:NB-ARC domains-containing protein [Tanacetum cinerariifolium]